MLLVNLSMFNVLAYYFFLCFESHRVHIVTNSLMDTFIAQSISYEQLSPDLFGTLIIWALEFCLVVATHAVSETRPWHSHVA
jgi:hypothetical protein